MKTEIVYSQTFNNHDNSMHPEHAARTDVMIQALNNSILKDQVTIIQPTLLPEEILYNVHTIDMISKIKVMDKIGGDWIGPDTYVCKDDYKTARYAAGGTLQLCKKVIDGEIDNGFALVRPPGHHATRSQSMGFCLFNNIAISSYELLKLNKNIFIFDLDVHHGNGTQEIFYSSDKLLYQSFHLSPHFPGTGSIEEIGCESGEGFSINAPLNYMNGEKTIQKLMDEIFTPIAHDFKPDIILVSVGYDGHYADRLGSLKIGINYFGKLLEILQEIQPKIVCTLEGGYNLDIIGKCFLSQIGQLCHKPIDFEDRVPKEKINTDIVIALKEKMKDYWDL